MALNSQVLFLFFLRKTVCQQIYALTYVIEFNAFKLKTMLKACLNYDTGIYCGNISIMSIHFPVNVKRAPKLYLSTYSLGHEWSHFGSVRVLTLAARGTKYARLPSGARYCGTGLCH